jgi:site-specific DNA recombinase
MTAAANKKVRCAIYTRVSTEAGLDQDFNSLDAQYDAAQAYIRSQAHAGWTLIRHRYDDGGFSGGSTDRPALQQLIADIKDHKINVVVVYKVDRLTLIAPTRRTRPISVSLYTLSYLLSYYLSLSLS